MRDLRWHAITRVVAASTWPPSRILSSANDTVRPHQALGYLTPAEWLDRSEAEDAEV